MLMYLYGVYDMLDVGICIDCAKLSRDVPS